MAKDGQRELFKDRPLINHRNENDYRQTLKDLIQAIRGKDPLLYPDPSIDQPEYRETRKLCDYTGERGGRVTEKRICRCIYYYNLAQPPARCATCQFKEKRKLRLEGHDVSIENYEVPTRYKEKDIGGIDLILKMDGEEYAVEVKPAGSKETIPRMVAEILTYTHLARQAYPPAICFFEGSKQWEEYGKWKDEPLFQKMLKESKVKVFYIARSDDGKFFSIHPMED